MTPDTRTISIACPACKRDASIEVPAFLLEKAQNGMVSIQVPQGRCCDIHSFMIFIDKHGKVRGYQNADVEFNLIAKKPRQGDGNDLLSFDAQELMDVVGTDISSTMLRAILVNKPICILDSADLYNYEKKIVAFLKDISSEEVPVNVRLVDQAELGDKKLEKEGPLVYSVDYHAILRSPFKEKIRTALEGGLLKETLDIPDRQGQVMFLRRELAKMSKIINELATSFKSGTHVYEEDLPKLVETTYKYKTSRKQVDGIKEIIAFKHGDKVAGKIKSRAVVYLGLEALPGGHD